MRKAAACASHKVTQWLWLSIFRVAELTYVCGRIDFFYCGRIGRVAELTCFPQTNWLMMHSKKTRNKSHICNWNELSGEKWFICSFWFFFFFFVGFYHLHVISDRFSDIFPPKILHFCSLSDSKLQETNFKRLISQNQIFRKTVY